MALILTIIMVINDNRFWLLPILCFVALYMLAVEIRDVFRGILDEMD